MSTVKPRPYFEKNLGQLPLDIKYKMKANDYITFFKDNKLIVVLPSNIENTKNTFYMNLENKSDKTCIKGECKQEGIVNYYIGNDESKWITDIPTYSRIKYEGIYENIDLYYYVNNRNLEYDFVLHKGSNPKDICISFEGIDNIEINEEENIVLTVGDVKAILLKPKVYQIIDNQEINIGCRYGLDNGNYLNFIVEEYDKEYELVLDPVLKLDYSTYIGGEGSDYARGIAVNSKGYMVIVGYTTGNYPSYGVVNYSGGPTDVFVSTIDTVTYGLKNSTYIGGNKSDYGTAIALDSQDNIYITGGTESSNFPAKGDVYNNSYMGNGDAFVAMLLPSAYYVYATFLGGTNYNIGSGIAVDSNNNVYVTGKTQQNFPITIDAYQMVFGGKTDAFVSKLNSTLSTLIYSTYLGGSGYDSGNGIAVDSEGCAYITGYAEANFPTTAGAFQTLNRGYTDAFVSKLSSDGSSLIYSTYLGGSRNDVANAIAIDSEGCAYITGYSWSSDYPMLNSSQYKDSNSDIIVSKLSSDGGSLIYSTYIGQESKNNAYDIVLDGKGCAYLTGFTLGDIFVCKVSSDGGSYNYQTVYHGDDCAGVGTGITLDRNGYIYIAGYARSGYPTTEDAYKTTFGGNYDVVTSRLYLMDNNLLFEHKPSKVKLLDTINTKLVFENLSIFNVDANIKFQPLDSSIEYIPNSACVRKIKQRLKELSDSIYIPNIPPQKTVEIELELKYISEVFPNKIPLEVIVEVYDNKLGTPKLAYTQSSKFYIETTIGPNYIPGCNKNLYNLSIDGELQTLEDGTPIIYYKSGSSYVYIESSEEKYIYKVLSNISNIVEHPIGT